MVLCLIYVDRRTECNDLTQLSRMMVGKAEVVLDRALPSVTPLATPIGMLKIQW